MKITEGELYPSVGLQGRGDSALGQQVPGDERFAASVVAALNVPLYEGGEVYARIRQAKETVGQRRIEADIDPRPVRAAWSSLLGPARSGARPRSSRRRPRSQAAETALTGVREEARVGQRTTLDVLNAQQELLNARVNLITAQRDRVVFSYALVQAMGRLTDARLSAQCRAVQRQAAFRPGQGPLVRGAHAGWALVPGRVRADSLRPHGLRGCENRGEHR